MCLFPSSFLQPFSLLAFLFYLISLPFPLALPFILSPPLTVSFLLSFPSTVSFPLYLPLSSEHPHLRFSCFLHLLPFYPQILSINLLHPLTHRLLSPFSSTCSAHPGRCDHRSHHWGGAGPAGAHCGHLLLDEVPGRTPRLQPQRQVSARPVAGGSLPVESLPGTGAEAGAHPWHRHLCGQAGLAAVPRFDLVRSVRFKYKFSRLERDNDLSFRLNLEKAPHKSKQDD